MWFCNILPVCVQKTKALRVATCRGCSAGSQSCGSVWDGWSKAWECNEMQRIKDVPNSCKLSVYTFPHPSFVQWFRATSTPSSSWNANVHSCEPLKALVRINNINIYIYSIYRDLYIVLQYDTLYIYIDTIHLYIEIIIMSFVYCAPCNGMEPLQIHQTCIYNCRMSCFTCKLFAEGVESWWLSMCSGVLEWCVWLCWH